MRLALRLARRGYGATSPNPMVGAVLVKGGQIIGRGWHRRAGRPHAEIEALQDARRGGRTTRGATLYVTLEPCCTRGRTPPCTDAIIAAGVRRVVVGAMDPNPKHAGNGFKVLRRAGIGADWWGEVPREPENKSKRRWAGASFHRKIADECARLNEAFNHWIVHRTPLVTVKAAMTLDGKTATASGESKWITGEKARAFGMRLRRGADAILVGVNTILTDDPQLTVRTRGEDGSWKTERPVRRIILDSLARTPATAKAVSDEYAAQTTVVVCKHAPKSRVAALAKRANILIAPTQKMGRSSARAGVSGAAPLQIDLGWLLRRLGRDNVTSLLVEGGGEVNASFLLGGLTQRVVFFYAPKILGGRDARKAVGGDGARSLAQAIPLRGVEWKKAGDDLMMTAKTASS